jgi:hypothetical protein
LTVSLPEVSIKAWLSLDPSNYINKNLRYKKPLSGGPDNGSKVLQSHELIIRPGSLIRSTKRKEGGMI